MKTFKILAIFIAAVTFIVTASAQSPKYDTATILRDADYILNRYEEVSLLVNIDAWTTSADVKARANAARHAISNNVEHRKRQLSAMLTRQNSTSPELLDVYAELLEVSGELGDLAYQSAEWGNSQQAADLAVLSSEAHTTSAKLYVNLRVKLEHLSTQSLTCGLRGKR